MQARRSFEVALILVRSGVLRHWMTGSERRRDDALGGALRCACEQAGGAYVKLGQFLSTRPDLVPAGVAAELRHLQKDVRPVPVAQVHRLLAEELDADPSVLFAAFDHRPVAAASIAQVHRATLPDGQHVAVKVQRPEAADRVARDVEVLLGLTARLERRVQWAADQRLERMARCFGDSLLGELNFEAEARNLGALRETVERHDDVIVPRPAPALTHRRVLVMDWVDGRPLVDAAGSLERDNRLRLARALLSCFVDQIFTAGVFHADPHPGNIYLTTGGRIALLDGGAVGRLDRRQRSGLLAMLAAVATREAQQLRLALTTVSAPGACIDRPALDRELGRLLDVHFKPGTAPDAALFGAFLDVMRRFGLALDPVVYGAFRALATLQITLDALAPDMDLLEEAINCGIGQQQPLAMAS